MNQMTANHDPRIPTAGVSDNGKKHWQAGTLTYTAAGLAALFAWLLWGDFTWAMKDRSISVVLQIMLKKHGASDAFTGALLGSLPPVIGMILSPIISYKSDRHRGKWGRRIPFMLVTIPFTVLSMVGLGLSPLLGTYLSQILGSYSPGLNTSVLINFALWWTLFDFASVVGNSVFGGLVNDVVPQAIIGRFYGMFRAVSLLAGIVFNYWLMGKAEDYYQWIFIGFGLLYGIGFTMTCLRVKEGEYPPPPVIPPHETGGLFPAVKGYFRDCFGISYYIWGFAGGTFALLSGLSINLFSVYYAKSVGMGMDTYGRCLAVTYGISLVMAYPLGYLADKFHPLRLGVVIMALYSLLTLWGGLYALNSFVFSIALVIHGVVSGAFITASASMAQRLFPNSKFAQFCSAGGIIASIASIAMSPLLGLFLDRTGHMYRYTFFIASGFAVLSVGAYLVFHKKFVQLGGPDNYVAPE